MRITQDDLIRITASNTGASLTEAKKFIDCYWEALNDNLSKGNTIYLYNKLKLEPVIRKERKGRHVQTGETLKIPKHVGLSVVPLSALKKTVKDIPVEQLENKDV